ncbi:MAG: phenylalanine--tRNA ligase beta subunit-related protein [Candidatus Hodarchaeales archaeon]|jgi:DNA/RNA-binding domain of Phe-tRNA-synthetase-like protein
MQVKITPDLKNLYPKAIFGSLKAMNVLNKKKNEFLEEQKRDLEKKIREVHIEMDEDSIIQNYNSYFEKWKKKYPIEYQIKTIKSGGNFPRVSVLVDSMFLAELNSRILTSGHDLDKIQGDLIFDVSKGGERYLMINGKEQKMKKNDVFLKDEEGILACILHGPARRTSIKSKTGNALYLAWSPFELEEEIINAHLNDILTKLNNVFETVTAETQLIRP